MFFFYIKIGIVVGRLLWIKSDTQGIMLQPTNEH